MLLSKDFDIVACVESWLDDTKTPRIHGFNLFRKDRVDETGGGLAVFLREWIEFDDLKIDNPGQFVEMCGIHLINTHPALDLFLCYRVPNVPTPISVWRKVASFATSNSNALLLGDFNAHHTAWNCVQTDTEGGKLHTILEESTHFLHNHDTLTHVSSQTGRKSNIDLIISTNSLADKILHELFEETFDSDHYPLALSITLRRNIYLKQSFKLDSKRTDWATATKEMDSHYSDFLTPEFIQLSRDKKYKEFTTIVAKP